jgi:hypothetical protein
MPLQYKNKKSKKSVKNKNKRRKVSRTRKGRKGYKGRKTRKSRRYMQKGGNEDITCYPGSMNFPKVLCDGMEEKMPPNIHSAKIIHPSQTQEIGSLSSLDKRDLLPFEPDQGGAVKDSSYT